MNKSRSLFAYDHALLLEGLRLLIERYHDSVGVVRDGQSVVSAAHRLKPDLAILDVARPMLNGLQAGKRLKEEIPEIAFLFLSLDEEAHCIEEAMRIGASGYMLKQSGGEELARATQAFLSGDTFVSEDLLPGAEHPSVFLPISPTAPLHHLTDPQPHIL